MDDWEWVIDLIGAVLNIVASVFDYLLFDSWRRKKK